MKAHSGLNACLAALLSAFLLSACGGDSSTLPVATVAIDSEAPQLVGNIATDGFNRINYRRWQIGIPAVQRNSLLDLAAQRHASYESMNNTLGHDEVSTRPGFSASDLLGRLNAAGFDFAPQASYAYGEVISATSGRNGAEIADELIGAIYHRFVIFEPAFKQAGAAAATATGADTYFITDFVASNGFAPGAGKLATYPFANQQQVPSVFYSDQEVPDPVPGQNAVGYPISVHANIDAILSVQDFSVAPRNGLPLPVRLLLNAGDPETPRSAAAIVPLQILDSNTLYDVRFAGSVDGVAVTLAWTFQTN